MDTVVITSITLFFRVRCVDESTLSLLLHEVSSIAILLGILTTSRAELETVMQTEK
jgi:hypothetical protein